VCGLWHGAEWTFVLWGLVAGMFLMVEQMATQSFGFDPEGPGILRRVYTLLGWMLGLTVLRSTDFGAMLTYIAELQGFADSNVELNAWIDPRFWWVVVGFALVHVATCLGVVDRAWRASWNPCSPSCWARGARWL